MAKLKLQIKGGELKQQSYNDSNGLPIKLIATSVDSLLLVSGLCKEVMQLL